MTPTAAPPDPATAFFAQQLRGLMADFQIRRLDSGKARKLTALSLFNLLQYRKPELNISRTQFYRYVHGERAPRLDELVAIAEVLEVSPCYFLQAQDGSDTVGSRGRGR